MHDFRKMKVWEKGHALTLAIYHVTSAFPREELFGLTSQMRRSCSSIPANIAEGCGRGSDAELARHLQIAMGSASELEYHFTLARDLGLMKVEEFSSLDNQVIEIKRMLTSFIQTLRANQKV